VQLVDGPAELLAQFERAWQIFINASQTFPIEPLRPTRGRRVGPWIVGTVLVAAALVAVVVVERRARTQTRAAVGPTPTVLLPLLAPTPLASPTAVPEPTQTPVPVGVLTIRTGPTRCWVSVRVAGAPAGSRLLSPNSSWQVDGRGQAVDLVFGDGGAASVDYMGESRSPVGKGGEVVHLHLPGATPQARPTGP
jgi:hypothetical protein